MDAERTILAGRAWSLLMDDVATQLLAGRGLAIPNLGVFTFAVRQERMGGASINGARAKADKWVLHRATPIFRLSSQLKQRTRLKEEPHGPAGPVIVRSVMWDALAARAGCSRRAAEGAVAGRLRRFTEAAASSGDATLDCGLVGAVRVAKRFATFAPSAELRRLLRGGGGGGAGGSSRPSSGSSGGPQFSADELAFLGASEQAGRWQQADEELAAEEAATEAALAKAAAAGDAAEVAATEVALAEAAAAGEAAKAEAVVAALAKVEKAAANINANEAAAQAGKVAWAAAEEAAAAETLTTTLVAAEAEAAATKAAAAKAAADAKRAEEAATVAAARAEWEAAKVEAVQAKVEAPPEIPRLDLDPAALRAAALAHPSRRTGGSTTTDRSHRVIPAWFAPPRHDKEAAAAPPPPIARRPSGRDGRAAVR